MATLTINRLGAQGDGAGDVDGRTVYVPLTAPGDVVSADVSGARGHLVEILSPSPDRVAPRCLHYGDCGGCSLQHIADPAYLAFKRFLVVDALKDQGIEADVAGTLAVPPRSRRRVVLAACRTPRGVSLGFHGRREHRIVAIRDCAVMDPEILGRLPDLARLAACAVPQKGSIGVTATRTRTGLDVALTGVDRQLPADRRLQAVELAAQLDFARVSINGEPILQREAPAVRAGDSWVTPPPGGFLQAVEHAELQMVRLVKEAVGDARRIADLFAGSGAFTLALAGNATVHAVESDVDAVRALLDASRRTQGLRPVTTETRDLFRQPLTPQELQRFDAVVLDPPRAGADSQCRSLGKSAVKRVAVVSCNATTFARDVRCLVDAGFKLGTVTPIDQFLWSSHIEIVAGLCR